MMTRTFPVTRPVALCAAIVAAFAGGAAEGAGVSLTVEAQAVPDTGTETGQVSYDSATGVTVVASPGGGFVNPGPGGTGRYSYSASVGIPPGNNTSMSDRPTIRATTTAVAATDSISTRISISCCRRT